MLLFNRDKVIHSRSRLSQYRDNISLVKSDHVASNPEGSDFPELWLESEEDDDSRMKHRVRCTAYRDG